jgi:hypothetical protein
LWTGFLESGGVVAPLNGKECFPMKIALLIVLVCAVSALAMARHLAGLTRKNGARRRRGGAPGKGIETCRLESHQDRARNHEYREYRRREKERHRRELARLDARIRRLEWRLAERTGRERPGEGLREDAAEKALAESLESMRSDRERLVQAFHERGRKAGALPGRLR